MQATLTHINKTLYPVKQGQTLVEFAFVCIVVFVILAGAFYVGNAMFQGQLASDAVKEPAMPTNKFAMADNPSAIGQGEIMGYVNQFEGGATNFVDNVNFVNAGNEVSIIIGQKITNTDFMGMPNFQFTVTQGLQQKLLQPANAGGAIVTNRTWLPGGQPQAPWQRFTNNMPELGLEYYGDCPDRVPVGGEAVIRAFISGFPNGDPAGHYMSRMPSAYASPFKIISFVRLGEMFKDECDGNRPVYRNACQANANILRWTEEVEYFPEEAGNVLDVCLPGGACYVQDGGADCAASGNKVEVRKINNPPGASGLKINIVKWPCQAPLSSAETIEALAGQGPELGVYDADDQPVTLNAPLPVKFVDDCVDRKVAECMFDMATTRAEAINTAFPDECRLSNKS